MKRNYEKWVFLGFLVLVSACGGSKRGSITGQGEVESADYPAEIRLENMIQKRGETPTSLRDYTILGVVDSGSLPAELQNATAGVIVGTLNLKIRHDEYLSFYDEKIIPITRLEEIATSAPIFMMTDPKDARAIWIFTVSSKEVLSLMSGSTPVEVQSKPEQVCTSIKISNKFLNDRIPAQTALCDRAGCRIQQYDNQYSRDSAHWLVKDCWDAVREYGVETNDVKLQVKYMEKGMLQNSHEAFEAKIVVNEQFNKLSGKVLVLSL